LHPKLTAALEVANAVSQVRYERLEVEEELPRPTQGWITTLGGEPESIEVVDVQRPPQSRFEGRRQRIVRHGQGAAATPRFLLNLPITPRIPTFVNETFFDMQCAAAPKAEFTCCSPCTFF
jgi:hypothetical protein